MFTIKVARCKCEERKYFGDMTIDSVDEKAASSEIKALTIWQQISNRLWGYDFFISYHWESGGKYAISLAQKLQDQRFDCFLDRTEYAMGDDWKRQGEYALRNSQRLVLIATPEAVSQSGPVAREVEIFSARSTRIIPVVFGTSFTDEQRRNSSVLLRIPESTLHILETDCSLLSPSATVIEQLVATHKVLRRRSLRNRIVVGVCIVFIAVFLCLVASSYWTHLASLDAEAKRAVAKQSIQDVGASAMDTYMAIEQSGFLTTPQASVLRLNVLTAASARIEAISKELQEDPSVGVHLSNVYVALANHLQNAGDLDDANRAYELAAKPLQPITIRGQLSSESKLQLAFIRNNIGRIRLIQGDELRALADFQSALDLAISVVDTEPDNIAAKRQLSVGYLNVGQLLQQSNPDKSEEFIEQGLELERTLAELENHADHRRFLYNYANSLRKHGNLTELRQASAICDRLVGRYDDSRTDLAIWEHRVSQAKCYIQLSQMDPESRPIDLLERAVETLKNARNDYKAQNHVLVQSHSIESLLASALQSLACEKLHIGNTGEALRDLIVAIEVLEPIVDYQQSLYLDQAMKVQLQVMSIILTNDAPNSSLMTPILRRSCKWLADPDPASPESLNLCIYHIEQLIDVSDKILMKVEEKKTAGFEINYYRAKLLHSLGLALNEVGRDAESIAAIFEAVGIYNLIATTRMSDASAIEDRGQSLEHLSVVASEAGNFELAIEAAHQLQKNCYYLRAYAAWIRCLEVKFWSANPTQEQIEKCIVMAADCKTELLKATDNLTMDELLYLADLLSGATRAEMNDVAGEQMLRSIAKRRSTDINNYSESKAP